MTLDRRRLLQLTGAAAVGSTTGLAGCADALGLGNGDALEGESGDPPAYADWVTLDADDNVLFMYADWAALREHDADGNVDGGEEEIEDPLEEETDPMLALSLAGYLWAGLFVNLDLAWGTGLDGLSVLDNDDEFETTIDATVVSHTAYVCLGSIDTDEVEEALTDVPSSAIVRTEYEQTTEIDGYAVYEPTDDDPSAFAVSGEAIVYVSGEDVDDYVEALREPIEAEAGERERAHEANANLEWLLGAAGEGHAVMGFSGEGEDPTEDGAENESEGNESEDIDEAFEPLQDATGAVSSIAIEGETESSGSFAAQFDGAIDGDLESDLEGSLGSAAVESDVTVEEDRVVASAEWDENVAQ